MAAGEGAYQRLCCDILSAPELCWQFGYSVFMPVVMGCFKCLKKYSKNITSNSTVITTQNTVNGKETIKMADRKI